MMPRFLRLEVTGMFQRVLISNRGEIAIRIAKAASSLGVESVGVYSPVERYRSIRESRPRPSS